MKCFNLSREETTFVYQHLVDYLGSVLKGSPEDFSVSIEYITPHNFDAPLEEIKIIQSTLLKITEYLNQNPPISS